MSELLALPVPFLLLLPISLAAGADFFLTLLVLGLSQSLGWPGITEPGLHPLHWSVLAGLAALYLFETAAEMRPISALFWHTLQLLFRPLGGILLALTFLDGSPAALQLLGALLAGVVGAFTHVLSWGQKLLFFLDPDRKVSLFARMLAEDTLVLAFLVLAMGRPDLAFPLSIPLLILGLIFGGPLHHVVRFSLHLLRDRIWSAVDAPRWRTSEELPHWAGETGAGESPGRVRGLPAAALGLGGKRRFREGWLLDTSTGYQFAFRRLMRPRVIPLPGFPPAGERTLDLARRVAMEGPNGNRWALFLQRHSPDIRSHK
ncbi:MAG: DUF4126 domain-containing protein [Gemmatimonadota bacterium]